MKLFQNFIKNYLFPIIIFGYLSTILFTSCTPQKKIVYLQSANGEKLDSNVLINKYYSNYKVRPGDNLYIKFTSFDKRTTNAFNGDDSYDDNNIQKTKNVINLYLDGYFVNDSGYIDIPVIGLIHVADSTLSQIKMDLQNKIKTYLTEVNVTVKLLNFNVTVIGEVKKPGTFPVYNERISILEAIGTAGDLTDYGNRNVLLIRTESNKTKMIKLNLLRDDIVQSEYFYLLPNDVIYVEPYNAKRFGFSTFPFGTILSSVTTLILVLNYLKIN